jgi:hypothetical protein
MVHVRVCILWFQNDALLPSELPLVLFWWGAPRNPGGAIEGVCGILMKTLPRPFITESYCASGNGDPSGIESDGSVVRLELVGFDSLCAESRFEARLMHEKGEEE